MSAVVRQWAQYECPSCGHVVEAMLTGVPLASPECPRDAATMLLAGVVERDSVGGTDPATIPATTVGDGEGGVGYLGLENAVLLEDLELSLVRAVRDGKPDTQDAVAIRVQGKINKRDERATVLLLTNADGVAAIVVECLGLADRIGEEYRRHVFHRVVALNRAGIEAELR